MEFTSPGHVVNIDLYAYNTWRTVQKYEVIHYTIIFTLLPPSTLKSKYCHHKRPKFIFFV